ncbi:glycoside hydrolase family 71 protein [Aspergillus homomorphus CBS 101889]|uniref:glucan endo-1,3-alpha-glucosidase n=1 Tax=Aspergillus homomorphus (strain CBS 101889) TaxID=1450537 RepID=A0A395HFZ6_ASPHC|nr:glycoside hydrolase [Aspergillus homomorphus CBS 101889]RAL06556.1 glycoside hydrolase [Aspergillus homomorphus CBS 101889]
MKWTISLRFAIFVLSIFPAHTFASVGVKRDDPPVSDRYVFAHFMVGIVKDYQMKDWIADIEAAQAIGIDAFALNCASVDSYTPTQLALAYKAADKLGFKVFISFDFDYWSNGDTAKITALTHQYANHPGQMKYRGGAVVSTFLGDNFDWGPVKQGTLDPIHVIANLQDPASAFSNRVRSVDGAFSWYAWPTNGDNSIVKGPMTTVWDDRFISNLAGTTYMAPVSPWFATHFDSKNWVFVCENLPTLRWEQILTLRPDLVEIISWNDYGESHYIGPYQTNHNDDGSSEWAQGMPHDAWRDLYQPYIAAFKSGAATPRLDKDSLVYWYRATPKSVLCPQDDLRPPNGISMLSDSIFVATMLTSPATLIVTSGSNAPVRIDVPAGIVTSNVSMGMGTQKFTVSRNGQTIMSGQGDLAVQNQSRYYNFNVYVGKIVRA